MGVKGRGSWGIMEDCKPCSVAGNRSGDVKSLTQTFTAFRT